MGYLAGRCGESCEHGHVRILARFSPYARARQVGARATHGMTQLGVGLTEGRVPAWKNGLT